MLVLPPRLTIRETARRLMRAERCTVFLVNRREGTLSFHTDEKEGRTEMSSASRLPS